MKKQQAAFKRGKRKEKEKRERPLGAVVYKRKRLPQRPGAKGAAFIEGDTGWQIY